MEKSADSPEFGEANDAPSRFYREIVIPDGEPAEIPPDVAPIDIAVTDIRKLEINGTTISLRTHQLCAWNILTALRYKEGGVSRADAYAMGFEPVLPGVERRPMNWAESIRNLREKLATAAGQEIIAAVRSGKITYYFLHPGARLIDQRPESDKPPGWYEFAQIIGNGPLYSPEPRTIKVENDDKPVEVIVRDDGAVVFGGRIVDGRIVGGRPVLFNAYESGLLNLLVLNNGQRLTHAQLWALGFHPYAETESARMILTRRAAGDLNRMFGGPADKPVIAYKVSPRASSVRLARSLRIIDLRPKANIPTFESMQERFLALLETAPIELEEIPRITMAPEKIKTLLDTYAHGLTLLQYYVLSLRFGIIRPDLRGTVLIRRGGDAFYYDELVRDIEAGKELQPEAVAAKFGTMLKDNAIIAEQTALRHLLEWSEGKRTIERFGDDHISQTLRALEGIEPADRLASFLNGDSVYRLGSAMGWTTGNTGALIFHLLPYRTNIRFRRELKGALQQIASLSSEVRAAIKASKAVAPAQAGRLMAAQLDLAKLTGPSQHNFDRVVLIDPAFGARGQQTVANALAFLDIYVRGMR